MYRREEGFSLVQVVIAAGLMGVLSLFMLKMQENQQMNQNKISMDGEINTFMQKLNGFLSRADYCEKNLVGKSVVSEEPFEIDQFLAPNGRVLFEKGELYGNRFFSLESIKDSEFFYDSEDKKTGNLTLMVTLKKNKKSFGADLIKKKIDLMVYLDDAGKISACNSNSFAGGTPSHNIKTEDVHQVVTGSVSNTDEMDEKTKQKHEVIRKTIESNPALLELQKSIKNLQKSNEAMKNLDFGD
ncbi:MAG: hypothetical protein CME63_11200 [Halobacteriovoraceae bacterium]|nr:hypothetical protein [Halobacteriovoraceae bacterium]|tara:strand:+ start:1412 stop:2137 length:726 start_codon:yes stop_codon:yes gene_type:complete